MNLKKGSNIFIRGCYGNGWPTEQLKGKNVVIIAGGTGVSPVKSLINQLYSEPGYAKEIYLILGFKNSQSILFTDELEQWKQAGHFHVICTLDNEDYPGWNKGMVTEFVKEIPFSSFGGNYECLVVGPPVMMRGKCPAPSANADIAELTKLMSVWTGLYLIIRSEKNW